MRIRTLAFLMGIVAFTQIPAMPSLPTVGLITLLIIAIGGALLVPYLGAVGALCGGFLWAMFCAHVIAADALDPSSEGKTVIITGEIMSLPEVRARSVRFEFQVDTMKKFTGAHLPPIGKVRLTSYQQHAEPFQIGDRWQFAVQLKRPHGLSNPGGFDYESWLFQRRIRATGYIKDSRHNHRLSESSRISVGHWRGLLKQKIGRLDSDHFTKGFALALGLGDRSLIAHRDWQTLLRTGTSHLLAISGLHIGLVAGLFFFMGRWLWALLGGAALWLPAQRFAAAAALVGAVCYAALAGFSIPTQRALIMLAACLLLIFWNRQRAVSEVIAIALLVVLIRDPFAVMNAGFWLSFAAISIIAYGMACRVNTDLSRQRRGAWQWGRVQYVVAVGLLPVLILWFQQYPVLGIFANLVAVPYVSLIVVPLVFIGVISLPIAFPLGGFILELAGDALRLLWHFLEYLAGFDFSLWHGASPSALAFAMAVIGVLIVLLPKGIPARWVGFFWCLPLLFPYAERPGAGEFWLAQLDVGQGLAAVVMTRNHVLVYDTGDRYSERFDLGEAALIPFLKFHQVKQLDRLILSHGDRDHIGGAGAVLARYPTTEVLTSMPDKVDHAFVNRCVAGQTWQWDDVHFELLHPAVAYHESGNNGSCVLKISNAQHAALLTGDIEADAEQYLLETRRRQLAATVLVVPHHGSLTSSTVPFIEAVSPDYAVFSAGYRNRFGLPRQDIIARYAARRIKILNTARDGALLFRFALSGLTVNRHRVVNRRFWTHMD